MKKVLITIAVILVLLIACSVIISAVGGIEMRAINPWLDKDNSSEIAKVEVFNKAYGVAPNSQVFCYSSTDGETIARLLDLYGKVKISPVLDYTDINLYVAADSERVVFTFNDGSTKSIKISNDYYNSGLFSFCMSNNTDISFEDMTVFFRFMASDESYRIYTIDDNSTPIKEIENGASELGFELYDGEADRNDATHIIKTSFGDIYVISDDICYLDIKNDELLCYYKDGYYKIHDRSFNDIIN